MPDLKINSIDCEVCKVEVEKTDLNLMGLVFNNICYLYHWECLPDYMRKHVERVKNGL